MIQSEFICSISLISRGKSAVKHAFFRRAFVTCLGLASLSCALSIEAADLSVTVVDRIGHGVDKAVVTATLAAAHVQPLPSPAPAVMDQKNLAFLPLVLVVGVGATVEFPNTDSVSHQVYSFSEAKHFQLSLYKGEPHPPVRFDRPGLVVLGCNIHDAMVGYIYVTDAPYFGTTEAGGSLQLKGLPAGDYRIAIWSPFIADLSASLVRTVHVASNEPAATRVQLSFEQRVLPERRPRRRDWEY